MTKKSLLEQQAARRYLYFNRLKLERNKFLASISGVAKYSDMVVEYDKQVSVEVSKNEEFR
jgi:hypothetical protein